MKNFLKKHTMDAIAIGFAMFLLLAQGVVLYYDQVKNRVEQDPQVLGISTPQTIQSQPEGDEQDLNNVSLQDVNSGVPVLMYHHIGDLPKKADKVRQDLTVSAANFSEQLDYLQEHNYHTITTAQLYDWTQGKFKLPANPIVITLDDGYKDAFDNAVPALVAHHMVGSFAIITNYQPFPDYADWPQIKTAMDLGMEIIPHTRTHIDLKRKYTHQTKVDEIQGSLKDIQDHLGVTPVAFVYPYGNYNDEAVQIVKDSGMKIAFTVHFGLFKKDANFLTEPRVRVHGLEDIKKFDVLLKTAAKK